MSESGEMGQRTREFGGQEFQLKLPHVICPLSVLLLLLLLLLLFLWVKASITFGLLKNCVLVFSYSHLFSCCLLALCLINIWLDAVPCTEWVYKGEVLWLGLGVLWCSHLHCFIRRVWLVNVRECVWAICLAGSWPLYVVHVAYWISLESKKKKKQVVITNLLAWT